jgi:hypothetical protein
MPNVLRRCCLGSILAVSLAAITPAAHAGDDGYYPHRDYDRDSYCDSRCDDRDYERHGYRYEEDGYDWRYRDDDYSRGDYRVCDSDGDRCYRSGEPFWDYREYYRRHGYHWESD